MDHVYSILTAHAGWILLFRTGISRLTNAPYFIIFVCFFLIPTILSCIHNKTWNIFQCIIVFVVLFDMCRGETVDLWGKRCWGWKRASRKPGGRAEGRFMAVVKEDMKLVGVREQDAEDRLWWRQVIGCGHPEGTTLRREHIFTGNKKRKKNVLCFCFCLYIELTLKNVTLI